jgi:hypothetical protein
VADGPFPWSGQPVRIMNGSAAEFRRALRHAFGEAVQGSADAPEIGVGRTSLRFALTELPAHRIGALQLPVLRVEVSILSGSDPEAAELLARVDRATQRGGG